MDLLSIKKRILWSIIVLFLTLSLFVFVTYAWFTGMFEDSVTAQMGFVQADINAYFDDGQGGQIAADEVEIALGVYKPGVYFINITSASNADFFDDFRLFIDVYSNVDTYIRIKILEQLTLKYTDYLGKETELSILTDQYMPFNYDVGTTTWYDNRTIDNYMYYKTPVQRIDGSTPLQIGLIPAAPSEAFATYSIGYTLQVAFSIEAVQASGGPENVWQLATPPWGGNW